MSQDRMTDVEWAIDPTCPIERVGGEWLVIHTVNGVESSVLRLSAASAEVLTRLRRGPAPLPEYLMDAASELEVWGVVHPVRTDPGLYLGRRQFIRMGAGGAAVGIAVLSLPTAAAASSSTIQATASGGSTQTFTYAGTCYTCHVFNEAGSATFTVTKGGLIDVLLVGGGGAGGTGANSGNDDTSSGGGGGAGGRALVSLGSVTVTPAGSPYSLTIGAGGTPSGTSGASGGGGGDTVAFALTAVGGGGGVGSSSSRSGGGNKRVDVSGGHDGGAGGSTLSGGGGAGAEGPGSNATGEFIGGNGGSALSLVSGFWMPSASPPGSVAGGGGGGGRDDAGGLGVEPGGRGATSGRDSTPGLLGGGGGGGFKNKAASAGGTGYLVIRYASLGPCS